MNSILKKDFKKESYESYDSKSKYKSYDISNNKLEYRKSEYEFLEKKKKSDPLVNIMKHYFEKKSAYFDKIDLNSKILSGMPRIQGTRIPVRLILAYLRDEEEFSALEEDFQLDIDDIREALDYVISIIGEPYNE